ncbi:hypothetical protein O2K51_13085 [Apibacter raozihei]|uniref:hypothetical protein n=1 Tax=Apibacter raozihei TaxID=2500547 RepID=UPI000FE398D3|nr:hypothetical protein [Apibacter raozihei]
MNIRYLFICLFILIVTGCSHKNKTAGDSTVIPAENVINPITAKKTKAKITGERNKVEIGTEKPDAWTILYKDDQGNLRSTIIKKQPEYKNQIGDSVVIYYDPTHPQSLPIYELQYLMLSQ